MTFFVKVANETKGLCFVDKVLWTFCFEIMLKVERAFFVKIVEYVMVFV